jgi:hypothetical protein
MSVRGKCLEDAHLSLFVLQGWKLCWECGADMMQTQKYDTVVQSMIEMGVDVVYPVELPNQSSLTIDGKNCFEPVVCKSLIT